MATEHKPIPEKEVQITIGCKTCQHAKIRKILNKGTIEILGPAPCGYCDDKCSAYNPIKDYFFKGFYKMAKS